MNYIISGKNIDVTDGLREAIYDKLGKLEKFFNPDTKVQVTLSVEKQRQKIEVTIPMKGHIIRAEQDSDDMYVSIDMVVEKIERQVVRYKKKIVDSKQDVAYFTNAFLDEDDDDEISTVAVQPSQQEFQESEGEDSDDSVLVVKHGKKVQANPFKDELEIRR